jgi:hypothetical protein
LVDPSFSDIIMVSEASTEEAWDMEKLVDQGLDLFLFGERVECFRNELNHIMGGEAQSGLKRLGQAVTACNDPPAAGAAAPDRPDAMRIYVTPSERADDPKNFIINLRCREIFQNLRLPAVRDYI